MFGLDINVYTTLVLVAAYLVRGIAGFGSGLIAIPLLSLVHPLTLVVPLVVILDYIGSALQGVSNREKIQWNELKPLLPSTLIGIVAALWVLKSVDLEVLNKALAMFVILFAVYQILPLPELRGSKIWSTPAGFFGGLIGTVFGTGGPFYMVYLQLRGLEKSETRASFAAYFFIDGSFRILGFLLIGMLSLPVLSKLLIWLPAAAVGLLIGGRVHAGISNQTFKYLISLVLVYSGYRLLFT